MSATPVPMPRLRARGRSSLSQRTGRAFARTHMRHAGRLSVPLAASCLVVRLVSRTSGRREPEACSDTSWLSMCTLRAERCRGRGGAVRVFYSACCTSCGRGQQTPRGHCHSVCGMCVRAIYLASRGRMRHAHDGRRALSSGERVSATRENPHRQHTGWHIQIEHVTGDVHERPG